MNSKDHDEIMKLLRTVPAVPVRKPGTNQRPKAKCKRGNFFSKKKQAS